MTEYNPFFMLGCTSAFMTPRVPSYVKLINLFERKAFSARSINFNSPEKKFVIETNEIAMVDVDVDTVHSNEPL